MLDGSIFFSVQALASGECSAWISLNMTCSSASYHDEQPMFSSNLPDSKPASGNRGCLFA